VFLRLGKDSSKRERGSGRQTGRQKKKREREDVKRVAGRGGEGVSIHEASRER